MEEIIAIVIFLVVIVAIMTEKVHRTAVALAGAVLLMLSHILTVDKAVGYIDFNTIGVLIGMMLLLPSSRTQVSLNILQSKRPSWPTVIRGRSWSLLW